MCMYRGAGARAASGGGKADRSFTGINLRMCTGAAPAEIREVSQGRAGCQDHIAAGGETAGAREYEWVWEWFEVA